MARQDDDQRGSTASALSRNPFRAERLGGFMPFFWYGMRTRHWLKLLASGSL